MSSHSFSFATLLLLVAHPAVAADAPARKAVKNADRAADKAGRAADAAADRAADKADAAADQKAADKAGNTAVVNGESLTAVTRRDTPAERFGRKRQLAISSEEALTISSQTISGVSGSTTTIQFEPAVDYFVIDSLSVGGFTEFQYTSASSGHSSTFAIGPRVGYNYAFSDLLSIWPKAGFSIAHSDTTSTVAVSPGATTSTSGGGTNLALNLFVPLLFHPATHFFAGFGPFLDADLSGDHRATTWGAKMTIGGWLTL